MNLKPFIPLSLFIIVIETKTIGQNISINATGANPDTSAMLDISSTTKGFLLPRMTNTQISSIPLPALGLITYSTTDNTFKYNIGSTSSPSWATFLSTNSSWNINGNSGCNSGTDFFGTTNNASLRFRVHNNEKMVLDSNGRVGIGTTAPTAVLHLLAGTTSANTAPLKFTSGVSSQTTLETGAVNYNGADLTLSDASYAYTINKSLNGSATIDFGATGGAAVSDATITVTGAAVGDIVTLGVPDAAVTSTGVFFAWVSAANTVTVRYSNKALISENPGSGTFKVRVIK